MRWAEPAWLALVPLAILPWLRDRGRPRIAWPSLAPFAGQGPGWAARLAWVPTMLLSLAIGLASVAMARPQTVGGQTRVAARGVAIVVAIDRSSSMKASDFAEAGRPVTRLDAAKKTLTRFLLGRPEDLVGVVAFANYPDPTCPPTLDHAFARAAVASLSPATGPDDGTNLGDALAWALDDLRKAPAIARVLVLLSDGRDDPNNIARPLDPRTAARLARSLGVTLHTIAVGGPGGLARDVDRASGLPVPREASGPDIPLLADLARLGGGRAFLANDAQALDDVFSAIDALEKSPIVGTILTRYDERFAPWALTALGLVTLSRLLLSGRLRRLP